MEIFSRECSKLITRLFPKYSGTGRTLSLLDEKIFLIGNGDPGSNPNQEDTYVTIENPREGLFGMQGLSELKHDSAVNSSAFFRLKKLNKKCVLMFDKLFI